MLAFVTKSYLLFHHRYISVECLGVVIELDQPCGKLHPHSRVWPVFPVFTCFYYIGKYFSVAK